MKKYRPIIESGKCDICGTKLKTGHTDLFTFIYCPKCNPELENLGES